MFSGTVIRATGAFTNNGTIVVSGGTNGGYGCVSINGLVYAVDAGANAFGQIAGIGSVTATNVAALGGVGYGVNSAYAREIVNVGPDAGGGGGGNGGSGGGGFTILAKGALVNSATGVIMASGEDASATTGCGSLGASFGGGGGGGGGGIVILASKTSIAQAGTIDVAGGAGGPSSASFAPGGGGSGGIVHLFAPQITHTGSEVVGGGAQGTVTTVVSTNPRGAGASGGATGGVPGSGSGLDTNNAVVAGTTGTTGQSASSLLDPSALFY